MERNLSDLSARHFDVAVIGGGIAGACIAWDACLRGFEVALVEAGDVGGATSAASGKILHGGIRYLQQAQLGRVRESRRERQVLANLAPHLVERVSFLVPTSGWGKRGRGLLCAGMAAYEALGWRLGERGTGAAQRGDRARLAIGRPQLLSRAAACRREPLLASLGTACSGAIAYDEYVMRNPERLTLAVARAAAEEGAAVATYVRACGFVRDGKRVTGVRVADVLGGAELVVRAHLVVNAAGPWAPPLAVGLAGGAAARLFHFAKGTHLITRPLTASSAIVLATAHRHGDSLWDRGGRHFFVVPWRDCSIVGTTYDPFTGDPATASPQPSEAHLLVAEINRALPGADLRLSDVRYAYSGVYLEQGGGSRAATAFGYRGGRENWFCDHLAADGIDGAISVVLAKYTTARLLAREVVDLVAHRLSPRATRPCATAVTPVWGGRVADSEAEARWLAESSGGLLPAEVARGLLSNHGSAASAVAAIALREPRAADRLAPGSTTIEAEVRYACREEMAQRAEDVIFRRTALGTTGDPGPGVTARVCVIMAEELAWSQDRRVAELEAVRRRFAALEPLAGGA